MPNLLSIGEAIKVSNKQQCGFLVILSWSISKLATFLYVVTLAFYVLYHATKSEYFLLLLFLTMFIAGWLSDVDFGRYKVIHVLFVSVDCLYTGYSYTLTVSKDMNYLAM